MSKKVMIILVTLLTSSLLGGINNVYAQEVDENKVTAENLLLMLTESEAEVTSLFNEIIDDGRNVPDKADEAFTVAQTLHEEAQTLFDEDRYEECLEKATDALNEYGKALERAQEADEEAEEEEEVETEDEEVEEETEEEIEDEEVEIEEKPEEEAEEETEVEVETEEEETENIVGQAEGKTVEEQAAKMIGLLSNIEKFKARIELLRDIANDLGLAIDADENQLLDEAYGILDSYELNFADLEESEIVFGKAVRLIGKATGMLKNQGQPKKEEKFDQFMLHTMNRVEKMKNKMANIMEKKGSPTAFSQTMQAKYDDIYTQLEGIDSKEDLRAAVKQLSQLMKETRKVGKGGDDSEEIFSEEAMESVEEQMTVEEQIEAYRIIVDEMSEDNPLKAEVMELLVMAENLLIEAETALSEDDEELANQKVDEAEEIIEAVEDLLGEEKGPGKGVKPEKDGENGKSNSHGKDDESTDESTEELEDPEEIEEPEDPEPN